MLGHPRAAVRERVRRCVFCGSPNLTNEHMFPRWTHRYMQPREPGKALSYRGTEYPDRSEFVVLKLPGASRDWQIKCVCGGSRHACNTGWMKDIEDKAKKIMKHIIIGNELRLSPKDQEIIATWAVLKSMISEFDFKNKGITHHMQRKRMMLRSLPPEQGWGVWIGNYERNELKIEWASRPMLLLSNDQAIRRAGAKARYFNSNCTTQIIGKMFIQVLHGPIPHLIKWWRFALPDRGTLFRIWPPTQFSLVWPGRAMTDRDAEVAVNAFAKFAANSHRKHSGRSAVT